MSMDNRVYQDYLSQTLPVMTLRVGLTGHIPHPEKLPAQNIPHVERAIGEIYSQIEKSLVHATNDPASQFLYQRNVQPILRIHSCLAEGIDRIAIPDKFEQVEKQLACILPFNKQEYANDFATEQSKNEFEHLLQQAGFGRPDGRVLELDGTRENADQSYLNASKLMIEHCDLLIAVYNGEHSPFGSYGTVQAAYHANIPVLYINSVDPNQVELHLGQNNKVQKYPYQAQLVNEVIVDKLCFTGIFDNNEKLQDEITKRYQRWIDESESIEVNLSTAPEYAYMGPIEEVKTSELSISKGFSVIKRLFAPAEKRKQVFAEWIAQRKVEPKDTKDANIDPNLCKTFNKIDVDTLYAAFLRADRLASHYGNLHRSTFVIIYVLAATAMVLAGSLLIKAWSDFSVILLSLKALALIGIYSLYKRDHVNHFHQRWLEYRALAEMLRAGFYLATLGTRYSSKEMRSSELMVLKEKLSIGGSERSWLLLYVETLQRYIGFNSQSFNSQQLAQTRQLLGNNWLQGQIYYHTKNVAEMQSISESLGVWSKWCFYATVGIVGVKLVVTFAKLHPFVYELYYTASWLQITSLLLAFSALLLPALGSMLFAIRNHAEFDISAQRSRTMHTNLKQELNTLPNIDGEFPRDKLSRKCLSISNLTVRETEEWLGIYEVKETEPG